MKQNGFTLLEMLITISVIAVIASLIVQVFFTTTRINTKTEVMKEVKQNGDFALDVMTRMIRNSTFISSACSGGPLNTLNITNPDGQGTIFTCSPDANNVLRIASQSAAVPLKFQYLTSSNVTLGTGAFCGTYLQFTCTSSNDTNKVTITFDLAQRGTPASLFEQARMPFKITVSTRNSRN
jgi:prepilin-type N-terminal cleavage/methylation domain-containing protein